MMPSRPGHPCRAGTLPGTGRGPKPAPANFCLTSPESRATLARYVSTAVGEYRVVSAPEEETTATTIEPSCACVAVVVRDTLPSSTRSAVTEPAPSSRMRSVDTREPARYRATVAMVAPPSRAIVISARSSPFSYTRACGPAAMGFSPLQNSIRLKTAKSRNPVNAYGMTKSHVTALRTYWSSTDLLMSTRLRVSWNLPKHPAETTTPTDTASASATTFPRRPFPIFSSLSSESDLDHCKSRRELLQCDRIPPMPRSTIVPGISIAPAWETMCERIRLWLRVKSRAPRWTREVGIFMISVRIRPGRHVRQQEPGR